MYVSVVSSALVVVVLFFFFATHALPSSSSFSNDEIPEDARADEFIMRNQRALGARITTHDLRWNSRSATAKQICSRNRHGAEWSGLLTRSSMFIDEVNRELDGGGGHVSFYDSAMHRPVFRVTTRPLFQFLDESIKHGWPSFRVEDVVWENVRILEDGEVVTIDGLHLGHNIPDEKGPRFCINLVCVSGFPAEERASSVVDGDEEGTLR